ncbi:hypothetical protein LAZ67_2004339 [Cordylochernes scorpioides]|uniref:Reverse transcriptase domain-containing protein n=1 Tax=Cordylochernes scorpioides TaxID=51811 RepID=A0ABY6K3R7_9ARAC|nr:hypothetical protein LAZ67_2004339 [Cordylochernes scorpioides]
MTTEKNLRICNLHNVISQNDPILNSEITNADIYKEIAGLKSNKACGPDGIPNEVLKILPDSYIQLLKQLYNSVMTTGKYPAIWTNSTIHPIFKNGYKNSPSNYRGIALISNVSKLFTSILRSRLEEWVEGRRVIPENQAGFRKGRSCIDHIFTLTTLIQLSLRKKRGKLYVFFVDLRKAFDTVKLTITSQQRRIVNITSIAITPETSNCIDAIAVLANHPLAFIHIWNKKVILALQELLTRVGLRTRLTWFTPSSPYGAATAHLGLVGHHGMLTVVIQSVLPFEAVPNMEADAFAADSNMSTDAAPPYPWSGTLAEVHQLGQLKSGFLKRSTPLLTMLLLVRDCLLVRVILLVSQLAFISEVRNAYGSQQKFRSGIVPKKIEDSLE